MSIARYLTKLGALLNSNGQVTALGLDPYAVQVGMKNRIINGAMMIDQRNAGASFTNSNTSVYGVDRWITSGLTSAVLTFQQVADAPAGYKNSFKCTVTTSTTANDQGGISQRVEANNAYDLMWGNSAGQSATLSFWVKASTAGTYCAAFTYFGGTATYYYVAPYTVTANTWTQVSLTIPSAPGGAGDFSGAMNTQYLYVQLVTLGSSGNTTYATANTWSSTAAYKTSGSINLASTSSATIQFTGVQLEKGSTATSFDYRPYGTELALCQRYYEKLRFLLAANYTAGGTTGNVIWFFKVEKRAVPTVSLASGSNVTPNTLDVDGFMGYTGGATYPYIYAGSTATAEL